MTSSNGSIFCVTGPLWGEFTGHRWILLLKTSDAELWCFLWSAPWIDGWVNNREAGDLRRHRVHYDVIVMNLCVPWSSKAALAHTKNDAWRPRLTQCVSGCIYSFSFNPLFTRSKLFNIDNHFFKTDGSHFRSRQVSLSELTFTLIYTQFLVAIIFHGHFLPRVFKIYAHNLPLVAFPQKAGMGQGPFSSGAEERRGRWDKTLH